MAVRVLQKPSDEILLTMDTALLRDGELQIFPASFYNAISPNDLAFWALKNGIYGFPTVELILWLRDQINGQTAIEIGSGNGAIGRALGIPATDSFIMHDPEVAKAYRAMGQPITEYGRNVEKLEASAAIEKYKPDIVIGCWVTQRWLSPSDNSNGSVYGVNEEFVLNSAKYILIGHENIHAGKRILKYKHEIFRPDWLVSRSEKAGNLIYVWDSPINLERR